MGIFTKIQWCDSTSNPTMGCEGCELWNEKTGDRTCYAGALHRRFGGKTKGFSPTFDEVTFWPGRVADATKWPDLQGTKRKEKPWLNDLPRLIFLSDMSDALSFVVPFDYLEQQVIQPVTSAAGLRHQWLWLTKRPERMAQFSDVLRAKNISWPANLWAGTSITTQATTSRIQSLLKVGCEGTIRFLSVEPQRGMIDFGNCLSKLNWVIQGGESGARARPFELEWAIDLMAQCQKTKTAYFLKQLGSVVHEDGIRRKFSDGHAGDWSEWPNYLRRRELPKMIHVRGDSLSEAAEPPVDRFWKNGEKIPLSLRIESKGRLAALKAWATRRENERRKQESA